MARCHAVESQNVAAEGLFDVFVIQEPWRPRNSSGTGGSEAYVDSRGDEDHIRYKRRRPCQRIESRIGLQMCLYSVGSLETQLTRYDLGAADAKLDEGSESQNDDEVIVQMHEENM